ncbi:uroporphyrinogen decarboxylase [Marinicella litoralis]|uniref:Uroporphyrinogen decarboxylase n=1 Tax=Marinicella litoralis TaxID=644220 RepID=A0A4R6Y3P4_9GAMM|nr:uroporphyrinogen decarboxylase [Marinicella litoralis]TDR23698.1 uroporphyrinogen decarboxylase [Marinicella litoralis]
MELQNDLYLRALRREKTERTPVWLMRQAGRYLPEYRKVRAQAGDFMTLASTPEMACEVTIQPLERFPLDAAIIFSDILTIPDAMGLGLYFETGEGPKFKNPISNAKQIADLPVPEADDLQYVMDAIALTTKTLNGRVPLIGFSGSPWTLLTYMIENGGSKTYAKSKALLYKTPELAHQLLDKLTQSIIKYLIGQIQSGASAVQVFDSWGGVLSPTDFQQFSLQYMQQIVTGLKAAGFGDTPIILFSKGANQSLTALSQTGCHALGVDWTIDIGKAQELTGNRVALQGNLDPATLYAPDAFIDTAVKKVIDEFGDQPGHVFNLGHGMQPDMQPEKVAVLVDAVRKHSTRKHEA